MSIAHDCAYLVHRYPCYDLELIVLQIGHYNTYEYLDTAQWIVAMIHMLLTLWTMWLL